MRKQHEHGFVLTPTAFPKAFIRLDAAAVAITAGYAALGPASNLLRNPSRQCWLDTLIKFDALHCNLPGEIGPIFTKILSVGDNSKIGPI